MYVYINSFKVKDGEEITFEELQKFEENNDAKPAGLIRYHLFKDRNAENNYWVLEYWESKEIREKMAENKMHQEFRVWRDSVLEEQPGRFECDVLV